MKNTIKNIKKFANKYYLLLFSLFFAPASFAVICWVEENKFRRLTATMIMAVIGLISIAYVGITDRKEAKINKDSSLQEEPPSK